MSLSIGIVGLPNVGKSTLFQALTKKQVLIANYPFATIDPATGVVSVPDERIGVLAKISKSEKIIPAAVEFVDIAGLVRGAHKGEGLGNKFLAAIRECDAIAEVVRSFPGETIHVAGRIDPKEDAEIIATELALADLDTATKRLRAAEVKGKAGMTRDIEREIAVMKKVHAHLAEGKPVRELVLDEDDRKVISDLHLLTDKPIIYVINVGEDGVGGTPPLSPPSKGGEIDRFPPLLEGRLGGVTNSQVVLCAKLEAELAALDEAAAQELLLAYGLAESGLNKLIHKAYETLGLVSFFTSGPKETRAWTIRRGAKAPNAAGVIHTDFEKGFIRAEVIAYDDFCLLYTSPSPRD